MQPVLHAAITDALTTLNIQTAVDFTIEHPADSGHGDYASNVALVVAKEAGQSPRAIAEQLQTALADQIEYVDRIDVAGPGFLNFYLSRDFFHAATQRVLKRGKEWGKNDSWQGKTVLVEYTDPNPFKEFHIGHLFTNAVGESIARLAMMQGADTKRLCYQGDVGLHVAHALWGLQDMGVAPGDTLDSTILGTAYARGATAYKEGDEAVVEAIKLINKSVYERSDETITALYDQGRAISLEYFESIYKFVGTAFDHYFFESEAGPLGKVLVEANPDVFPESDGARVFKGEEHGLHTRVFINREGLPTYEAKELALAKLKADVVGPYDLSIISTANEINEYFKVLLAAMTHVYPELAAKTEHIGHGMVRLQTGKMSSRTGDVIPALSFIDEVATAASEKIAAVAHDNTDSIDDSDTLSRQIAIAAIKYTTLKGSIEHDTVFDKERALSFEGDSGPYLQYTHARIHSVLEKAAAAGVTTMTVKVPEAPYAVEHLLYRFEEVIEQAFNERAPHKVTGYLTELASAFNTFYATEKIADPSDEYAPYKVQLAHAVAQTLRNGLWVLGIETPERM